MNSKFKIQIGNCTDIGKVRRINEDNYGYISGHFGDLLIICDGMGGHKGGEIASGLSVESIKKHFASIRNNFDPVRELRLSIEEANYGLIETAKNDPALNDMGSTVVIALLTGNKAYTANLGDSRIYLCRKGVISQLTKDHSLVQQMVDTNIISAEEAKFHPKKNVITRSLGIGMLTEPDISNEIVLEDNDIFILCSDGLTTYVEDNEILGIAVKNSAQDAANRLVDLANERGGEDNITVQVARILSDN
jgi:protein phosphatase